VTGQREWTPSGLEGRHALVTGAGRGIGRAVAGLLAEAGASLTLTARSGHELDAVAAAIRSAGGTADTVAGDITDDAFVEALFASIDERAGRLDVLVNNAGMAQFGPVADVPPAQLRRTLELNTVAPYACMRLAVTRMRAGSDDGHIVNVGSVESYWTKQGESGAYPASKFALRALTLAVAKELKLGGSGIRVSMVNPGGTDTTLVNPEGEDNPRLLDPQIVAQAILHTVTAPPGVHVLDTIVVAQVATYW
jgi:Short-chain dehydrogenases of various substrate specificities